MANLTESPLLSRVIRFLWVEERIADARAKFLGPDQSGWREFELARNARDAIEDIKESGPASYAALLLLRAEILLLVRCNLLRSDQSPTEETLFISDWEALRKQTSINELFLNLSSNQLAYVEAALGKNSEAYLVSLESKLRDDAAAGLKQIAAALMGPLEHEAGAVNRLKIIRWSRISVVVGVAIVLVGLASGWFRDKAGTTNLAFHRPVLVSSQIAGIGSDHRLLVDGDYTNVGFHTDSLPDQFVVIDLGSAKAFDKVVVYNRTDCCKERAIPLRLEVSDDNVNYKKLAERTLEFDVWTASMLRAKGRYVRLRLQGKNPFHLAEVEIF